MKISFSKKLDKMNVRVELWSKIIYRHDNISNTRGEGNCNDVDVTEGGRITFTRIDTKILYLAVC